MLFLEEVPLETLDEVEFLIFNFLCLLLLDEDDDFLSPNWSDFLSPDWFLWIVVDGDDDASEADDVMRRSVT